MSQSDQLYGLCWRTAYEDYEILAIYRKKDVAEFHAKKMNENMRANGVDDEEVYIKPVEDDGEGWVREIQ